MSFSLQAQQRLKAREVICSYFFEVSKRALRARRVW